jgi:UDP-N-acetylmuramate--alanine ligase
MRQIPLDIGGLHFVGVGGIGMSGVAEILHNLGYRVTGSDLVENANVRRLRALGVEVAIGHRAANLKDSAVVVMSSAVKPDNPEVLAARAKFLPVVRRAEMLAEIMRLKWSIAVAGTHGKTTTTSLIAAILDAAGVDPTVVNGGIINAYGTNARLGAGEWVVAEADESDGTFVKLPATVAVVTNIDPEHLDFYGSFERLREAFQAFVENLPFYGFAALCLDHREVQALMGKISDRKIITFGFSPQADVRAADLVLDSGGARFDALITERVQGRSRRIENLRLPMLGRHNVLNALGAIAVARELGFDDADIARALAGFAGVNRRFTRTGEAAGIVVIDDYAHHPVEIEAVLAAARQAGAGRVIAVMQPHRYSRLGSLFEEFCTCFNQADTVIIADVYAAGEAPIEGIGRDALIEGVRRRGHRRVIALNDPSELAPLILAEAQPGDMVICLGAGSITAWAHNLPEAMARMLEAKRAGGHG